jgi:DNA-binding response OmpR family regulator
MAKRPVVALVCLSADISGELATYLKRRGHDVRAADEQWEGRPLLTSPEVDVAVIGDLLRQVGGTPQEPSIIVMRPPSDLMEKVLVLEFGAADVVEAPFSIREIAARIGGLLARRGRAVPELVALENSTVDLKSALVMHQSGEEDLLSPGQVALFRLLLANPRKVLTRDDIMAAAPAENLDAFDRSIDSRIVRLRRKLDTESIVTIRGSGDRFDPPDQETALRAIRTMSEPDFGRRRCVDLRITRHVVRIGPVAQQHAGDAGEYQKRLAIDQRGEQPFGEFRFHGRFPSCVERDGILEAARPFIGESSKPKRQRPSILRMRRLASSQATTKRSAA